MTDLKELRRLAEAAIAAQDNIVGPYNDEMAIAWGKALQAYTKAANPAAVIELLDEIEAMQCCGNCRNSAINFSGGSKMLCKMRIMGAMDNYAKEKCEKWQGVK